MAERPGFYVAFDWRKSIERLSDEKKGRLLQVMLDYAEYGEAPEFPDPSMLFLWDFIKPRLDHDGERYDQTVLNKRRNAFAKG